NHHDGKFQTLRLMDGHHLDVALRKWLIGVFVFIDAAIVKQPQKAVEQMKPEILTILESDNRVVVVVLKRVQELREDRKTACTILIFDKSRERRECDQKVKVFRWPPVQRAALSKMRNLVCVFTQRRA